MAGKSYQADSIEVLEGLDPVRKRPGMYTDTTRPNHLAQEVIDNSVDEALEGHANEIRVTLRKDGSMSVGDNGRGMPVDIHKKEKVPGVELILTRLHSGAKFNSDNYKFSGGLHGVGVSVVNALSSQFEVFIKRDGKLHHMAFKDGNKAKNLAVKDDVGKRNTGGPVSLRDVILRAREMVSGLALARNITVLTAGLEDNEVKVYADERAMLQVVLNLLSNAVKYGDEGCTVNVTVQDPDAESGVSIIFADAGAGIPKERMDYILTPFGRLGNNDAYKSGGTGLGLPIVKSLVDMHGGDFTIDSTVGIGTTVTVKLPAVRRLT